MTSCAPHNLSSDIYPLPVSLQCSTIEYLEALQKHVTGNTIVSITQPPAFAIARETQLREQQIGYAITGSIPLGLYDSLYRI